MTTDRITMVMVVFENADGSERLARTYTMEPSATFIKGQEPQGKIPGRLELFGPYTKHRDAAYIHPSVDFPIRKGKIRRLDLPWPEVHSIYSDDGPSKRIEFEILGVRFLVAPTKHCGCDTGRTRYFVECISCGEVVHEATTGPRCLIEDHMEQVHDWKRVE